MIQWILKVGDKEIVATTDPKALAAVYESLRLELATVIGIRGVLLSHKCHPYTERVFIPAVNMSDSKPFLYQLAVRVEAIKGTLQAAKKNFSRYC